MVDLREFKKIKTLWDSHLFERAKRVIDNKKNEIREGLYYKIMNGQYVMEVV